MNKEEILAKSRKEGKDEGVAYAQDKGRRIGISAMTIMFLVIIIYNLAKGLTNNAVFALFWTYLGFESYGKYRFTKGKTELTGAVAGIFAGITFFITYLVNTVR